MAGKVPNDVRDTVMHAFRERVCEQLGVAPFLHQREVWAATQGLTLTGGEAEDGLTVRLENGQFARLAYGPRPAGVARFVSDLGAFKVGKSFGVALWASGFGAVPGARVALVGIEYDLCEPEFSYIEEFLLSERGMNMKYSSRQNRPQDGKMWLHLDNDCRFECKSWARKDSLKGKEIDAYIYCEAYQLPGIECFTAFSQNLRVRKGYAYFPTTPDRPWVNDLHRLGHGEDPEWHCTCSVPAEANPISFDAAAKRRDVSLMTKEKFAIHYGGQLGDFVGRVFNYARGQRTFNRVSHADLFRVGSTSGSNRVDLRVPPGWEIVSAVDTGTYYTGLTVAFDPSGTAFVIEEFPNYRYVGGEAERDEWITIPGWSKQVTEKVAEMGGRPNFWADQNTQFKAELRNYGMNLLAAKLGVEARTEVTREYFQHDRIWLAPWLEVLPFELENAAWPEEVTSAGKFARVKDRDHTLDCLEHILGRRPIGRRPTEVKHQTWADWMGLKRRKVNGNPHLGRQ